jgi:hypothetical protein
MWRSCPSRYFISEAKLISIKLRSIVKVLQNVRRWLLTTKALVTSCEICDGPSGTRAGFIFEILPFSDANHLPTVKSIIFITTAVKTSNPTSSHNSSISICHHFLGCAVALTRRHTVMSLVSKSEASSRIRHLAACSVRKVNKSSRAKLVSPHLV